MAQLNITLDDGFLKALMLGDREKGYDDAMRHLLEQVFNAVLSAEATEQVGGGLVRTQCRATDLS
jgi:cystathionine beta-lyase family protein involved in aluminum resistance